MLEKRLKADYVKYVNPFIGTDFTGNTYPRAQVPFGMVQLSPDNGLPGWDRIAGYFIRTVPLPDSVTHLSGTGAGDLYDISFMPVTHPVKELQLFGNSLPVFAYNGKLLRRDITGFAEDYNINVTDCHGDVCGIQKYTFPKADASVYLNLAKAMNWDFTTNSKIDEVVDSVTIRGYRYSEGWARGQRIYFVSKFSKPFGRIQTRYYICY